MESFLALYLKEELMAQYLKALSAAELQPGTGKTVVVGGEAVAVFNADGRFYAIADSCVHRGGPLGEGALHGCEVACPWHGWEFNLKTGEAAHNAALKAKTYPVRVEGPDVFVAV